VSITEAPRPAVAPSLCLLAGIALAGRGPGWLALGCACVAVAAFRASFPAGRRWFVVGALACSIAFVLGALVERSERREWLATRDAAFRAPFEPLEMELEASVLAPATRDRTGEVVLRVRGRAVEAGDTPSLPMVVALRLPAPAHDSRPRPEELRRGARIRLWCRLSWPRGSGNPGSPDPELGLRARGLHAPGRVKSWQLVERIGTPGRHPLLPFDALRRAMRARLDRVAGDEASRRGLLGAMLLGDRGGLESETERLLRGAGMIHLVAISGLHVGLVVIMAFHLLRRLTRGRWGLTLCCVVLVGGYASLVGGRPSVLRASIGCAMVLLGRCVGREGDPLNTLACLASALLLLHPGSLYAPGFQLTFLATAGILVLSGVGGPAERRRAGLPPVLKVPVAAYLGAAPAVAWHFGWLAPVGVVSNLAATPLCAVLLASGYGSIVTSGVPWLGPASSAVARCAADALLELASAAASVEAGSFIVARPSPWLVALHYALLASCLAMRAGGGRTAVPRVLRAALALCVLALHVGPQPPGRGALEIAALDVGQGQSVAIRGPSGSTLLVDGGGARVDRFDPGARIVLPYLRAQGVRRLEALVVSHGDLDHAGGAEAILRDMEVGELWLGPAFQRHPRLRRLADVAVRQGTAVVLVWRGFEARRAGIPLQVLGPARGWPSSRLPENDRSLVLHGGQPPCRFLVPGDLESGGERELLARVPEIAAEALIVGHHGSRDASHAAFLRAVDPEIAVISCGFRDRFDHPHPDVLRRLRSRGAGVFRTDIDGLVRLRSGRDGWSVETQRDVGRLSAGSASAPEIRSVLQGDERDRDERQQENGEQQ